ncbi:MAG: Mov34/MPN/PAD-1 family protein [Phycisphaerae bacterium]
MALVLMRPQLETVCFHALAESPEECCGFLVGRVESGRAEVREVHAAANVWEGDREHRFMIDPRAHLKLQRECRQRGLDIIGFYHSHPGGPPVPSAFDAELAWPGVHYLIVSLRDGCPQEVKSWQFDTTMGGFLEEILDVQEP